MLTTRLDKALKYIGALSVFSLAICLPLFVFGGDDDDADYAPPYIPVPSSSSGGSEGETGSPATQQETGSPATQQESGSPATQQESGSPATPLNGPSITIFDPLNGLTIEGIFLAILEIIMVLAVPIVVFFIIWAGFLYVTAQGNQSKIEQAHKALTWAVVGGLIVLGARVILEIIETTIGLFVA